MEKSKCVQCHVPVCYKSDRVVVLQLCMYCVKLCTYDERKGELKMRRCDLVSDASGGTCWY